MTFQSISDWFWDPHFWLPPNIKWADIKSTNERRYPEARDLWVPIYLAILVMAIRYLFERYFAMPLGRYFKLSDQPVMPHHPKPSAVNKSKKHLLSNGTGQKAALHPANGHVGTNGLSKIRQAHAPELSCALRRRSRDLYAAWQSLRRPAKPGPLTKFSESCWRFTYYVLAFAYGIVLLWNKPWFADSNECWIGYPFQTVSSGIYWYYMIEMAFYWSLMFTQFKDVKRKDFWQMFTHHICTILLMTFSWIDNMVRMGTLVLVIHDAVDFWMEAAKMANYCKSHKLCNTIFAIFTLMWFITRLILYPYRVIYPALFIAHLNMDSFFAAYYLYNGLLILLYVLHVIWFVTICKIATKSIRCGKVEKDERSSSEHETDSEIDDEGEGEKEDHMPDKRISSNGIFSSKYKSNDHKSLLNGTRRQKVQ